MTTPAICAPSGEPPRSGIAIGIGAARARLTSITALGVPDAAAGSGAAGAAAGGAGGAAGCARAASGAEISAAVPRAGGGGW